LLNFNFCQTFQKIFEPNQINSFIICFVSTFLLKKFEIKKNANLQLQIAKKKEKVDYNVGILEVQFWLENEQHCGLT
jgi:hypothetical protein